MWTKRKTRWLIGIATFFTLAVVALLVTASILAGRAEPYIREQAIEYLRTRFDSDVELAALRVRVPNLSAFRLVRYRGHGTIARVEGQRISLRLHGRRDIPPLFTIGTFTFDVDLGALLDTPKTIPLVKLDGMEINIPASGGDPSFDAEGAPDTQEASVNTGVIIDKVVINNATLNILSKQKHKDPLHFSIHHLEMDSAGRDVAMKYTASLTNATPPGEIVSSGTFGPWIAIEPGKTPLTGQYQFYEADLSVFDAIGGILHSTGQFDGTLSTIHVHGEADVPDFHLKMSGNRIPLKTRFEVQVDGTNGNTVLKPVVARLGSTDFTTSGAVLKEHGQPLRTIRLDVSMPNGDLRDILRLAMKGSPYMTGRVALKAKIDIPPLYRNVREKLRLAGTFQLSNSKFLHSTVQDKIDSLSRRSQGQPTNEEIDEVVTGMKGMFNLDAQVIRFQSLEFAVPGALINLAGDYRLNGPLDLHGTLRLQARLSQTMTGWKRWVLKPADPFFARNGAGTFLHIKVEGTADDPKFGLDRGKH